jgi:hypothetical protein
MRWARHVAHMKKMRTGHEILVKNPQGKRPLGRTNGTLENNIKIDVSKIQCECVDQILLDQDMVC